MDEKNSIPAEDFAKSLLICLPLNQTNQYLKRIQNLNIEGSVSFEEFIAFAFFIDELDQIKQKVLAFRYIT